MYCAQRPGKTFALCAALLGSLALGACTTSPSGSGRLELKLIDAPILGANVDAVTVSFSRIEVHRETPGDESASGWIAFQDTSKTLAQRTFNLLDLVGGTEAILADAPLEAGHYTQIRVFLESATITVDGQESELRIPSSEQTGVKLIHGFDVRAGETTHLTLDFDVDRSVHETPPGSGLFVMKPTIRVVQPEATGSISGTVTPIGIAAVVNVYETGTTTLVASAHVDAATGAYVVKGLAPGTYDIEIVATGFTTVMQAGIAVTAGVESSGHDVTMTPAGP